MANERLHRMISAGAAMALDIATHQQASRERTEDSDMPSHDEDASLQTAAREGAADAPRGADHADAPTFDDDQERAALRGKPGPGMISNSS